MARTVTRTVYQYSELSDKAKEKARDWFRESSYGDSFWSEHIIEEAAEIGKMFGLTISSRPVKLMSGATRLDPDVCWSGFWSQGDGASFSGRYYYKDGGLAAVKEFAPLDEKLHSIVAEIEGVQAKYNNEIMGTITSSSWYSHSGGMACEFETESDIYDGIETDDERTLIEAFRSYADWIYKSLETEYEYQNSDEAVTESIEANEYEFEEDGHRARD